MANKLRVVGKNVERIGAREKVIGVTKFTGDLWQYGMLYCKILRSPYAHAKIINIDTNKAESLEGVEAVLTYKDVPQVMFGEDGADDAYVLPDRARFVGDEVVAVAAETEDIAERALELIDVEYEELPIALTPEEALKPEAPLIPPPEWSKSNLLEGMVRTMSRDWGDVDEGFEQADHVFENEYSAACIQHMPLEPKAYLARWDDGKLTVWASTQRPFALRIVMARVLDMPENKVRIISPYVGGGFGSKGEAARYPLIITLLAKKAGKPVRLTMAREEDMLSRTRPATDVQLKVGVKRDGTFTAMHGKLTAYAGGYNWCLTTACSTTPMRALFRCPNCRFDARSVYTNHPSTGQMRGVMNTIMSFGLLQLADQIAEELDFSNPIEFIEKTRIQVGDECDTVNDIPGCTLSSCGLDECLGKGAEAIGWEKKWKGWKTPVRVEGNRRVGIGMAAIVHDTGLPWMVSGAVIKINVDGTADFLTPVTEIGNAAVTTQTQVVSEASGIPFEDINVIFADTELAPVDPMGQVSSGTAHVRSLASKKAGEDAKQQLLECAAPQLNTEPEALDIENGRIYVRSDSSRSITVKSLMEQTEFGGVMPVVGRGTAACPRWPQRAFNYAAHFAIVAVDTQTGEIKVLKYVAAHDVGRALNPQVCEAQIQGGVVMGLSSTFNEELVFDENGKPLNLNLTDYKIFTTADCPEITPIIVEPDDPLGGYGAKGFAEAPLVGAPACVANAIYNAIGIRFRELPITPEKVLKALKKGELN